MFKRYQFKTCIILIITLLFSSLLMRQGSLLRLPAIEFVIYTLSLTFTISFSWFVHGYFLLNNMRGLSHSLKRFYAGIITVIIATGSYYLTRYFFPKMELIENRYIESDFQNFLVHTVSGFFISFICYAILNNLLTTETLQTTRLENEQLKQAHLRAQLLSLQQQVSPHFLFNSLGTLKTLSHNQEAKDYIVQLAKVYRHLLNFNEHHLTSLRDELSFLKSYLYILNLRFEDSLSVMINIEEEQLDYFIPPLSLQLLVENAIKHNVTSPDRPLRIGIYTTDNHELIIENNFAPKQSETEGMGMGLQNINDRYQLLVHKPISIYSDQYIFSVTLPLML